MAGGRPKFQIDYKMVEKLANIMCTEEEIASILGCSVRTLQRDEEFCHVFKKGQDVGKMSLRRNQWKISEHNPTMAIFLGKQYLGQRDKIEDIDNSQIEKVEELLSKLKDEAEDGSN